MGIKRIIDVQFWNDDKVLEYFSPEDKLFMLYLMTNPHTTQLGIYPINKKHMSFELGYTTDVINVLLERFEKKYNMIRYSEETKEIAIKNYLRHSIIKGGKPVEDCLMKEIKQVKDKSLLGYVYSSIKDCETLNETVKKVIETFNEYDNDNDNENENENEDTLPYRDRIGEIQLDIVSDEYQNIKEEILGNKENGDKICEWCNCKTTVLHKHHYPIPKRLGGKEIVNICSNCHNEFHVREGKKFGGSNSELIITTNESDTCKVVINRLNELAGTNYRSNSKATQNLIKALLKEYSKEDILMVVEKMCYKWLNPKKGEKDMSEYLRPSTLFRKSNFENYYGMKVQQRLTTKDLTIDITNF